VRSAGGPPPAVTENGSSHLLPAYERRAEALFADGRLVSVCTYDARRVAATALLGVVDAHPLVLYALDGNERLEVRVTDETSLAPAGWIDVTTLGSLTEPLARAIRFGEDVVVDLRDIDFVDVAGLRLFVEAARELHARGRRLRLTHLPGPVPTMIALLGYDEEPGLEVA
jgi:anti-anti-sigma factor